MKKTIMLLPILLLASCSLFPNLDLGGMFNGSSPRNDQRFEESMAYNDSVPSRYPDLTMPNDEYTIYVGTDFHVDTTWRTTAAFAKEAAAKADMVLLLGDMVNAQNNYPHFWEGIRALRESFVPWYATAGNHDIYFGQWSVFKQYFGTSTYFFTVTTPSARDLYICLDSSDGTLGVKQLAWLRALLAQKQEEGFRHTIVFTHTHMFKRDGSQGHTSNYVLEETYEITSLLSRYGVDWYVSGHDHSREVTEYKGVKYIIVDANNDAEPKPGYMMAAVGGTLAYRFGSTDELLKKQ